MDSYRSMKAKLKPLGLYVLNGESAVDAELKAYAAGLDPLFEELAVMEREAFVQTAESFGLSEREQFIEMEKPDLPIEKRRALLIGAEQTLGCSGTPEDFEVFFRAIGLEMAEYVEKPRNRLLQFFVSDNLTQAEIKLAAEKILKASPPHINVTVRFLDDSEYSN